MAKSIRRGFTLIELLVVMAIIALLAAILIPALSRVRETSRRANCGSNVKQIVIAQTNYQSQRAASKGDNYLVGPLDTVGKAIRCTDASGTTKIYADASKAFIALAKLSLVDTLAAYSCPSDPFIAILSATGRSIPTPPAAPFTYEDFPVEGTAAASTVWTDPNSPAATEVGHTFYSYSQQSRSANQYSSMSPKMDPRIPVVGERNPFSVSNVIAGIGSPVAGGYDAGNAWSHNREGGSVAYMDARVEFVPDARMMTLAVDPVTSSSQGFAYLYGNAVVSATAPSGPASGSCPSRAPTTPFPVPASGVATTGYAYITAGNGWGIWLTD